MRKTIAGALTGALLLPMNLNAQAMPKKKGPVGISGWVTFWDEGHRSITSFEKHADQIDRAYFEMYKCGADGLPFRLKDVTPELFARVMAAAKKHNVETWYTTGNFDVEISMHNKTWIQKFLYDDALRAKHIQMLIRFAREDGVQGIQIDYENLLAADKGAFTQFMNELGKACKANKLLLGIALPAKVDATGTWDDPQSRDYGAIGKVTDQFVPMTYDLHWSTSTAGAVTSPEWAETVVKYSMSVMEPGRLEVGYPAYGYDWVGNKGESITWPKFQELVKKYNVTPIRDADYSQELYIRYTDEKGQKHEAWMPDSVSLEYQADIVKRNKIYGLGVWFFGSEDESFWQAMKKINSTPAETKGTVTASMNAYASASSSSGPLKALEFLTDNVGADYAYAYPAGQSKISVVEKQGKRWAALALKGNAWSGAGMGTARKNLVPYLKTGALQFYVRGAKGGETLSIGFVMEKGMQEDEKYTLTVELPVNNYASVTDKWQLVTMPLSDFPANGRKFVDETGQNVTGPFKWNRVLEIAIGHAPSADPVMEVQLSSIRVIPSYNAKAVERAKFSALSK